MDGTSKLKLWLTPGIIFIILVLVVASTTLIHHQIEDSHRIEKSAQIANAISKNMSREIEYRLQALTVFSSSMHMPPNDREFAAAAKYLRSEYSGFFAINYIASDGTIRKVYPYKENKAALNQNLLVRDDVRQYLIDSKSDGKPRSSHRIMTYQGIYAIVLYVPLYDLEKKFFGWMNGVLYIDHCLVDYMKDKNLSNVTARVRWHHPAETNTLAHNWNNPAEFYTTEYKIMNQTVSIDLAMSKSELDQKRTGIYYTTLAVRTGLVLVIALLVLLLTFSKIRLQNANVQLSFKNNMLNSLSHDLASPLTSLNLVLDAAIQKGELSASTRDKIHSLLRTIECMLKSVRLLHSYGSGMKTIPMDGVPLLQAVNDAVGLIDQIALAKKIKFEISPDLNDSLKVKANAHTLVNNVLLNGLSNAVKFSPVEGTVTISHRNENNRVSLIIIDQGNGLTPNDLQKFNLFSSIDSKEGTSGEVGTGLGLLQICGFMKIYDGAVHLENNTPKGTKLTLTFEKA